MSYLCEFILKSLHEISLRTTLFTSVLIELAFCGFSPWQSLLSQSSYLQYLSLSTILHPTISSLNEKFSPITLNTSKSQLSFILSVWSWQNCALREISQPPPFTGSSHAGQTPSSNTAIASILTLSGKITGCSLLRGCLNKSAGHACGMQFQYCQKLCKLSKSPIGFMHSWKLAELVFLFWFHISHKTHVLNKGYSDSIYYRKAVEMSFRKWKDYNSMSSCCGLSAHRGRVCLRRTINLREHYNVARTLIS